MFDALRERDFRLLFTGQTFSLIGSSITTVALAFAVLEIGTTTDLGIVVAAGLVPLVAFLLIGGVLADRLPRQWVMLVSDVVRFACQAVMAWLLLTHRATIAELVVLQFVRGTAEAFFRPAQTGLVPHTISAGRLQQANALRGLTDSLGVTLGAAMGGVLVALIGSGWAIGLDSLSYLVSAWFLWGLRGLVPATSGLSGSLAAAESGLTAGLSDGAVRLPNESLPARPAWRLAGVPLAHLAVGRGLRGGRVPPADHRAAMVLGPYVAKHSLGGAAAWGAILASHGVGQVIGGVGGLRLRPARRCFCAAGSPCSRCRCLPSSRSATARRR